jgi:hypothetical protein
MLALPVLTICGIALFAAEPTWLLALVLIPFCRRVIRMTRLVLLPLCAVLIAVMLMV